MYNEEDIILYIPELGDNRELEEGNQVSCDLLPMTGEEVRAYQRAMVGTKPSSPQAMRKAEAVVKRIITERVVNIENYEDIKGEPILNGEELFERGETALVDEVYEALSSISKLKAGQRKN
jgi:hypothetical protein